MDVFKTTDAKSSASGMRYRRDMEAVKLPSGGLETFEERCLFDGSMLLGANTHYVNLKTEHLSAPLYLDVMRNARPWQDDRADAVDDSFDANGWPLSFADNQGAMVTYAGLDLTQQPNQAIDWVIEAVGTGEVTLQISGVNNSELGPTGSLSASSFTFSGSNATASSQVFSVTSNPNASNASQNIHLKITVESSGDTSGNHYLHDIKIYPSGTQFNDPDKIDFNPTYLSTFSGAGLSVIRMMDMSETNNTDLREWTPYHPINNTDGRTTRDYWTQGAANGISMEEAVRLAVETNSDLWVTIPHKAIETLGGSQAEDYVGGLSELLTDPVDGLQVDQKVYVEYTNETWNDQFQQDDYLDQAFAADIARYGQIVDLNSTQYDDVWERRDLIASEYSAQIWDAMATVFNDSNPTNPDPELAAKTMVRVLGARAYESSYADRRMGALEIPELNPTGQKADAIAIAPYFRAPGLGHIGWDGNAITETEILARSWEHANRNPDDIDESGNTPSISSSLLAENPFTGGAGQPNANTIFEDVWDALRNRSTIQNKNNFGGQYISEAVERHEDIADTYGIDLIAYEGGQEIGVPDEFVRVGQSSTTSLSTAQMEDLAEEIVAANRNIGMNDVYDGFLDRIEAEGISTFVHYSFVQSADISFNSNNQTYESFNWGLLEDLHDTGAPKYMAFDDFVPASNLAPFARVLVGNSTVIDGLDGEIIPFEVVSGAIGGARTITLDGSQSRDLDGTNSLTYSWKIDGVSAGSASTLTSTFDPGTYEIELTVNDGSGATGGTDQDTKTFLLTLVEAGATAIITGQTQSHAGGGIAASNLGLPLTLDASGYLGSGSQQIISLPDTEAKFGSGVTGGSWLVNDFAATGWEQTTLAGALATNDYFAVPISLSSRTANGVTTPLTFMPQSVSINIVSNNGLGERDMAVVIVPDGTNPTVNDVWAKVSQVAKIDENPLATIDLRQSVAAQPLEGDFEVRFYFYGTEVASPPPVTGSQHVGVKKLSGSGDPPEFVLEGTFSLRGDYNADGMLDANDIDALGDAVYAGSSVTDDNRFMDLNDDGLFDFGDAEQWIINPLVFGSYIGDANLDGQVNLLDLDVIGQNWGQSNTNWSGGDFNLDGIVDLLDLDLFGQNWGSGT